MPRLSRINDGCGYDWVSAHRRCRRSVNMCRQKRSARGVSRGVCEVAGQHRHPGHALRRRRQHGLGWRTGCMGWWLDSCLNLLCWWRRHDGTIVWKIGRWQTLAGFGESRALFRGLWGMKCVSRAFARWLGSIVILAMLCDVDDNTDIVLKVVARQLPQPCVLVAAAMMEPSSHGSPWSLGKSEDGRHWLRRVSGAVPRVVGNEVCIPWCLRGGRRRTCADV
ncbi:hypothetical protein B0T16DRAFT_9473 [Cercophora newfieldiana]|uniref:Uncharacterized protein n=1 Tax=Cercophora newfieldiana TaxID=92897 RepID=A0AA39YMT6_9PEZI|nr:hypothetical protein B0T16DRAFT_9473 [Cercophora newfieldiana]